jgi:hypothetical protein
MNWSELLKIKIGPFEIRGELLILIGIMSWILFFSLCVSCLKFKFNITHVFGAAKGIIEGFTEKGAPIASAVTQIYVPPSPLLAKDLNIYPRSTISPADNLAVSTAKGNLLAETVEGTPIGAEYKLTPEFKPLQMSAGELDMMASTKFKPDCCPSTYSTASGCACLEDHQKTFLLQRGGNNFPVSEY